MKTLFVVLSLVWASSASSLAVAQNASGTPTSTSASAVVASSNMGAVESIDILKQNQAERSRDQPGNAAPTFRLVNDGTKHYSSLPALEAGVLIQGKAQFPGQARATTAGEAWREYRNGPLTMIGGWLLLIVAAMIAGFYYWRGEIKLQTALTGRLIERFTPGERTLHWSMALSFVSLAVSGIVILFGKHVLLPVFGLTLFGWLAFLCKNIHNFIGPVFTISTLLFFIKFVKDNLPDATDLPWLAKFGGLLSGEHVSSGRFNAGEKILFWGGVVGLGLVVSGSGLVLDMLVPALEYSRANMQIANIIHVVAAMLAASMVMGHIYLGTIGMQGAYASMRTGYVDDAWAKEHHEAWYTDIENGKIARVRSEQAPAHSVNTVNTASLNV